MKALYRGIIFSLVCCVLGVSCLSFTVFDCFAAGRYTGEGRGYRGKIRVLVETNATSIIHIEVEASNEDEHTGGDAIDELIALILESNSTAVDAVSGATVSSEGFISAVDEALAQARVKRY